MTHRYKLLVEFISEVELSDPTQFVVDSIIGNVGHFTPEDAEFSVVKESVVCVVNNLTPKKLDMKDAIDIIMGDTP